MKRLTGDSAKDKWLEEFDKKFNPTEHENNVGNENTIIFRCDECGAELPWLGSGCGDCGYEGKLG